MGKKLSPEEEKLVETVIEKLKGLVRKYGYEYTLAGCNRYIKNTKAKQKLLKEIKLSEQKLSGLKDKL